MKYIVSIIISFVIGAFTMKAFDNYNIKESNNAIELSGSNKETIKTSDSLSQPTQQAHDKSELILLEHCKRKDNAQALFVENSTFKSVGSFSELVSSIPSEQAELFQNLNEDLYGLINFKDEYTYELLKNNGLPTPEELEFVHSTTTSDLIDEIRYIYKQSEDNYTYPKKMHRLTALTLNKAINEFIYEYKKYYPNYIYGEKIEDFGNKDWPEDVLAAEENVQILRGWSVSDLAIARMAALRYREVSHIAIGDHKDTLLGKAAYISNQIPRWDAKQYFETGNWEEDEVNQFYSILNGMSR